MDEFSGPWVGGAARCDPAAVLASERQRRVTPQRMDLEIPLPEGAGGAEDRQARQTPVFADCREVPVPPSGSSVTGPTVSVVIAAYDEPEMLREAIESVADQDFRDFELIVIDDGSSRDLGPAIEMASVRLGERLRIERQLNAGAAAARNRGVELARGRWVALLDHDDLWLPNKLTRQLAAAAAHPEAAMIYCQYRGFGEGVGNKISPPHGASGRILADLLDSTLIRTLSVVLIRRDVFGQQPWFDSRYRYANDIDLYYRLAQRHPVAFVEEVLVRKRSHPAQASRNRLEAHDESVSIVRRLRASLGDAVDAPLERAMRNRLCRHLLGAAKAAKARGDRALSHRRYAELLESNRLHLRGWRGWLSTRF